MITAELKGKELDYWVAKAQGWTQFCNWWVVDGNNVVKSIDKCPINAYTPTTLGSQCFELLETNDFETESWHVDGDEESHYAHIVGSNYGSHGLTLNEAVCRALVASRYGEKVGS